MKKKFNVIFLGRGKIASDCFNILKNNFFKKYFDTKVIVSNEDFFLSNKKNINNNVKKIFNKKNSESKILKSIKQNKINLLISVLHPWLLSPRVLSEINYNAFNLHNGDLPGYRGWNATGHAIINGEKNISTVIHKMVETIDEGPIVFQKKIKIEKNTSAVDLYKKIIKAASINFNNFLKGIINNKIKSKKIPSGGKFYKKNELELLKKLKIKLSEKQHKIILGSYIPPYEPAYTKFNNKKVYLIPKQIFDELINKQKKIN